MIARASFAVLVLLACGAAAAELPFEQADTSKLARARFHWSTLGGSAQRTGLAPVDGPRQFRKKWVLDLNATKGTQAQPWVGLGVESLNMAIGSDGTLYVACTGSYPEPAGWLAAIRSDGTEKWRLRMPGTFERRSGPSVARDGAIYVTEDNGALVAVDPEGFERWRFKAWPSLSGSVPTIGEDGRVYVASPGGFAPRDGGVVYALYGRGKVLWKYRCAQSVFSVGLAVSPGGTLYIATAEPGLVALGRHGDLKWQVKIEQDPNDTAYAEALRHKNWSNVDPYPLWGIHAAPLVLGNGNVVVATLDGLVHVFSPEGGLVWKGGLPGEIRATPASDADGDLHIGVYGYRDMKPYLYKVQPGSGVLWQQPLDPFLSGHGG